MELALTEDQQLLVASFGAFFRDRSDVSVARAAESTMGFDERLWRDFAELGGSTLLVDAAQTSAGGGLLDAVLVAIEAGRHLAPVPIADTVAAFKLLAAAGVAPSALPNSEATIVGVCDAAGRVVLSTVGAVAEALVVPDGDDLVVFAVDAAARRWTPNLGHLPMGEVDLVAAAPIVRCTPPRSAWDQWRAVRRILISATLVGVGLRAVEHAREHLIGRRQFGRQLATFQALQHRLADCATGLEASRLLTCRAASYTPDEGVSGYLAAAALRSAAECAEVATRECMQFLGGYGYSLEDDAHLFLRFVKTWRVLAVDREVARLCMGGAESWT